VVAALASAREGIIMRRNKEPGAVRQAETPHAVSGTAASADRRAADADLLAEERSEDDGMPEHAEKAADPVRWAARREPLK
jgi:hypothetical protein